MAGSYSEAGGWLSVRERERGDQRDGRGVNTLLTDPQQPLAEGSGRRVRERQTGEEWGEEDMEVEEKGRRLFFREKDCSAWAKWTGRGRGVVDKVVSMVTDIILSAGAGGGQPSAPL